MNKSFWWVRGGIAGLALLCITQGCTGSIAAGSIGASCAKHADCNPGLACLSQICVQAPGSSAAAGAGVGGGSGSGGNGGADSGADSDAGAGRGCNASNTVAASPSGLIADFADADGGIEIMGGLFDYGTGPNDLNAPTGTIDAGVLHITQNAPATSSPQYVGVFVYFNQCVDASAFSGVKFSIGGSFTGCTMQIFANDVEHFDATTGAPFATGLPGSYQPQYVLPPSQLSSTPQAMTVAFTSQVGGSPATPLDPSALVGWSWQFTIPAAQPDSGAPACVADLTIDDMSFF